MVLLSTQHYVNGFILVTPKRLRYLAFMKWQIYRTDYSPYFSSTFKERERELFSQFSELEIRDDWPNTKNILITNTSTRTEDIPIQVLKQCELIIHPNSGYDNFSAHFVSGFDFPIVLGNSIRAQGVAEYILSCLFQHFSKIPKQNEWNKSRQWNRKLISELNIQILGYGHIGKKVYASLNAMGAQVSVYDPYKKSQNESLLQKNIDVLILACGLNQDNKDFINKAFFKSCSEDLLIINGARGGLIHEADLINFLETNNEAYAYLDVFQEEPLVDEHPFFQQKNINITSHIAGCSNSLENKILDFENKVLYDFFNEKNFDKIYTESLLKNHLIEGILI